MCMCMHLFMYVWVGRWERACMYMHIMCVIVYPSNCDDIDLSNGVIATYFYGTMVTILSWNCSYLYIGHGITKYHACT